MLTLPLHTPHPNPSYNPSPFSATPKVLLNGVAHERELLLHAVAKGGQYMHLFGNQDLMFFMQTEVLTSPHVGSSIGFTVFATIL